MMPLSLQYYYEHYAWCLFSSCRSFFGLFDSGVALFSLQLLELKTKLFNSIWNVCFFLHANSVFIFHCMHWYLSIYLLLCVLILYVYVLFGVVLFCTCAVYKR